MAYIVYNCDTMTGGAARSLDILSVGALTTGDRAIVMTTAASYFFKYNSAGTAAEQVATAPRVVRPDDYSSGGNWEEYVASVSTTASVLAQIQHASTGSVVSGSTIMPIDDTIPQNTEGIEALTCAITPKSASNLLVIQALVNGIYGIASPYTFGIALFQDTTAGALAASFAYANTYSATPISLTYKMTAGTVSETTFKLRFGQASAGTIGINSYAAGPARVFGGVAATTLTIFEYTP